MRLSTIRNTIIIDDLMVKNVQSWKLKAALKQNEKVRLFSGAKIADMADCIICSMEENADLYIVHFGTNDLRTDAHAEKIAQRVFSVAMKIKTHANAMTISGLCLYLGVINIAANLKK